MASVSLRPPTCSPLLGRVTRTARPLKRPNRNLVLMAAAGGRQPLVVVGSVNSDLVLHVDRLPKPGETLGAEDLSYFPGGKGANQAAAAGRLGYPTIFLGQVGTDANASMLVESLRECHVDLSLLRTVEGPSGTAIILLQPDGENSIIIVGGANTQGWEITDEARKVLQSAGGVLLQREIPEAVNMEVARITSAAGVPLIVDAGGVDAALDPALLSSTTVFSPNETELARLTGMPANSVEEATAAAREAQRRGATDVLVKRGSEGSLLVPRDGPVIVQPAAPVDKVVDTTGAGDCFTASFAVALLEGLTPQECLRFAGIAAALCVQRAGAMPSMPSRQEVDALFKKS